MTIMHNSLLNNTIYQRFKSLYEQQDSLNSKQLDDVYASEIVFKDPVHTVNNLRDLKTYFANVNKNLNMCRFEFTEELVTGKNAHISWNMFFSHPKIARGKEIKVRGMSFITFENDKIIYHEDSYDIGAMVYEHLPLLGLITRWIKARVAG